jgi:hypothetical protein
MYTMYTIAEFVYFVLFVTNIARSQLDVVIFKSDSLLSENTLILCVYTEDYICVLLVRYYKNYFSGLL